MCQVEKTVHVLRFYKKPVSKFDELHLSFASKGYLYINRVNRGDVIAIQSFCKLLMVNEKWASLMSKIVNLASIIVAMISRL